MRLNDCPIDATLLGIKYQIPILSVRRRATPASTAHTLYSLIFLQLRFGYPTDAGCVEVGLFGLDAGKAAQLLNI